MNISQPDVELSQNADSQADWQLPGDDAALSLLMSRENDFQKEIAKA